eukprot:ANDGO_06697.mRNA.1 hypothetical protein
MGQERASRKKSLPNVDKTICMPTAEIAIAATSSFSSSASVTEESGTSDTRASSGAVNVAVISLFCAGEAVEAAAVEIARVAAVGRTGCHANASTTFGDSIHTGDGTDDEEDGGARVRMHTNRERCGAYRA